MQTSNFANPTRKSNITFVKSWLILCYWTLGNQEIFRNQMVHRQLYGMMHLAVLRVSPYLWNFCSHHNKSYLYNCHRIFDANMMSLVESKRNTKRLQVPVIKDNTK